jgi:hypothetical protein
LRKRFHNLCLRVDLIKLILSAIEGWCTLAKFLGKIVSDGDSNRLGYVLALATLGGVTQVESFLFMLHHPRWPRQIQSHIPVIGLIVLHFTNEWEIQLKTLAKEALVSSIEI